jgi:hypothetical protein
MEDADRSTGAEPPQPYTRAQAPAPRRVPSSKLHAPLRTRRARTRRPEAQPRGNRPDPVQHRDPARAEQPTVSSPSVSSSRVMKLNASVLPLPLLSSMNAMNAINGALNPSAALYSPSPGDLSPPLTLSIKAQPSPCPSPSPSSPSLSSCSRHARSRVTRPPSNHRPSSVDRRSRHHRARNSPTSSQSASPSVVPHRRRA